MCGGGGQQAAPTPKPAPTLPDVASNRDDGSAGKADPRRIAGTDTTALGALGTGGNGTPTTATLGG
jgi:hypothetical protein